MRSDIKPSMRPAQIAREITSPCEKHRRTGEPFNEARANCAGNFGLRQGVRQQPLMPSMRPAQIAREIEPNCRICLPQVSPSMRPAQIAREIT